MPDRLLVPSAALALLVACAHAAELPAEPTGDAPVAVQTAPVVVRPLAAPLHGAGRVRASDEVTLSFPFGGILAERRVEAGDRVHRGEVVAVLDAVAARAQLSQARSALEKAERDAARAAVLEGTAGSAQQRQDAETGLAVARANVDAAGFQARRSTLVAPADGVIVAVYAEADQTVGAGTPVVRIAPDGAWEVEASLSAADALAVSPGTPATLALAAFPGQPLTGHVLRRAGGAGPLGTWTVEIGLDPTPLPIASGLVAAVALRPEGEAHPVVPLSAIAEGNGTSAVVYEVTEAGVARRVPVQVAFIAGEDVALTAASADLGEVVTVGTPFVRDGARVVREVR